MISLSLALQLQQTTTYSTMATTMAGHALYFGRRKTACRSKPPKGISIKKQKREPERDSDSDGDRDRGSKRTRLCSTVTIATGIMDEYESLGIISRGSYGRVYKVRDKRTGEILAVKEEIAGLSAETLMEINVLKSLPSHPSVVGFKKVVEDEFGEVYVVMEYMQTDLGRYIRERKEMLEEGEVKMLMKQLLEGVEFLHRNGVMHRDMKPSNVLVSNQGDGVVVKLCDFGQSTRFEEGVIASYSPRMCTLWYRAPELLLGGKEEHYSTEVDMWSVGCIMAELVLKKVLFRGNNEYDQLREIYCILGFPDLKDSNLISSAKSRLSETGFDLLKGLLDYDVTKRITARSALNHAWFQQN